MAQGSRQKQVWSLTIDILLVFLQSIISKKKGTFVPSQAFDLQKAHIEGCVSGQTCTERALLIVLMASKRSYWNLMRSNSVGEALPAAD